MDIAKIRRCAVLLPFPGPEVVAMLADEIERLRAEISTAEAVHKVAVAERNYERQRADILESATIKALEDRDRLRTELAECRDALAKIGPYYVPSTDLSDDEVNAIYAMIDAACKGEEK